MTKTVEIQASDYIFSDGPNHRVYITKPIGAPSSYIELYELLTNVQDHETIDFFFNTPGGRVDTVVQIAELMERCKATINGHLMGMVASGGTVLAMYVDNLAVSPHCYMMIHNFSGGAYGKGEDLVMSAANSAEWVKRLYRECYHVFLTEDEIENQILKNQDIYLSPEQILERWEKVLAYREEQEELYVKEYTEGQVNAIKDQFREEIIAEYLANKKKNKKSVSKQQ